jgi:hypothetical protein
VSPLVWSLSTKIEKRSRQRLSAPWSIKPAIYSEQFGRENGKTNIVILIESPKGLEQSQRHLRHDLCDNLLDDDVRLVIHEQPV